MERRSGASRPLAGCQGLSTLAELLVVVPMDAAQPS
jgi:hypothetical protein